MIKSCPHRYVCFHLIQQIEYLTYQSIESNVEIILQTNIYIKQSCSMIFNISYVPFGRASLVMYQQGREVPTTKYN